MAKKEGYNIRMIDTLYNYIPAFTDIFDEETWYISVACFVVATTVSVFILSRFVTINPVD